MARKASTDVTLKFAHHQQTIADGILRCFEEKCLVDVNMESGENIISAHKLILGIFCPVLLTSLKDADTDASTRIKVDSSNENGQCLTYLLEFLYRGQVTLPHQSLKDVFNVAEKLEVQGLLDAIKKLKGKFRLSDDSPHPEKAIKEETEADNKNEEEEEDETESKMEVLDEPNREPKRRKRKLAQKSSSESEIDDAFDDFYEREGDEDLEDEDGEEEEEDGGDEEEEEGPAVKKSNLGLRSGMVTRSKKKVSRVAYKKKWRQTRPMMKCADCDYETRDKYTFKSHLAKHDPKVGGFVCDICSKTFRSKRGFRCHLRGHQDPGGLYNCTHCSFYTPQKWTWLQHLAVLHKVDPEGNPLTENVKCPECDYVCVANHQLKAHMIRKHTVDKPFKCKECNYAAVIRYELDKHISIIHRKERPYMCETCGFRSQTQSGFERHKRSHTGVKPFKCELCGQEYADNRKFKTHLLRHVNDEKPYVCHLCGHSCRRKDNLSMHMKRIHKTTIECEIEVPVVAAETTVSNCETTEVCIIANPDSTFQMVNFFDVRDSLDSGKNSGPPSPADMVHLNSKHDEIHII